MKQQIHTFTRCVRQPLQDGSRVISPLKGFRRSLWCALVIPLLLISSYACADRDDTYVRNLSGGEGQIQVRLVGFLTADADDATLENWKRTLTLWAETTWLDMRRQGFKAPVTESTSSGANLLRIRVEKHDWPEGGNTSPNSEILVKTSGLDTRWLRFLTRNILVHEMTHMLQFAYIDRGLGGGSLARYVNTLIEGTAVLGQELLLQETYQYNQSHTTSFDNQLIYPGGNLFFRPGGSERDSVDKTALWWKYLLQAFTDKSGHQAGIDTLVRLYRFLEPAAGWRARALDRYMAPEDYTGDGRQEIIAMSDTHIGLLNPVFFRPGSQDIVPAGYRFSGGWLFNSTDRIEASCNLTADEKAEFVIRSDSHLGVIGSGENGRMKTLAAIPYGARLGGGWLLSENDRILGAADLDGNGYCELLIRSDRYIGAIGLTPDGASRTLHAQPFGYRYGGGWLAREDDRLLTIGDMTGDGKDTFIVLSNSHIGVIGFDARRRQFVTLGARTLQSLDFDGLPIRADTRVLGVDPLRPGQAPRLVVSNGHALATIWLRSRGGLDARIMGGFYTDDEFDGTLADVDGNGVAEMVLLSKTRGLIILEAGPDASVRPRIRSRFESLTDGFNGSEYRAQWQITEQTKLLATGDFDGDGRDDFMFSDDDAYTVVTLTEEDALRLRMLRRYDSHRFENLQDRLAQFIGSESAGTRTLNSMLSDQATANIVSGYWQPGISERFRYLDELTAIGTLDFDDDPTTPAVNVETTMKIGRSPLWTNSQLPWSNQYVRVDLDFGPARLRFSQKRLTNVGAYRLVVFDGQQVVDIIEHDVADDTLIDLDFPAGHFVIVAVVAHEVPLDYRMALTPM